MAKFVFGIDLGTTYSCIAYVDETGRATVIDNSEGTNTTPSVVNFASPTNVVVGQVAKDSKVMEPQQTVDFVKRLMGKSDFAVSYNGRDISPQEVSSYILRKLTEDAAKLINEEVKDVVITCPAYFGAAERDATKKAGDIAGLNVLEVISEPVAASIYYGYTKEQNKKNILVYDLGGGTFDVTVMAISSDVIEVICCEGDHELGGKDWDETVMRYIIGEFNSKTGYNGDIDESTQADLRLKVENAKIQLSGREETPITLDAAGLRERIPLSRVTFDELSAALLSKTIDLTDKAIEIARTKGVEIDEIILVGGSTKMPQVPKILKEKYGREPKILEPNVAVAKGAALYAVDVYINKQKSIFTWEQNTKNTGGDAPPPPVENVNAFKETLAGAVRTQKTRKIIVTTTKSYALEVLVGNKDEKCNNLIIKNTRIDGDDISVTGHFGTQEADQETVELVVYESDDMNEYYDIDHDLIIGTAVLPLPANLPAGSPIDVTFTLNKEGMLKVHGKDLTGNREITAEMRAKGIMTTEEVEEAKKRSSQIVVM
ncbi:MAG: Hsp70 family protein [Treponema sp.]|jgi:molecular chaperone DnaK (HSP70)|nr:Hsp70 family protein [Treponema sp.]